MNTLPMHNSALKKCQLPDDVWLFCAGEIQAPNMALDYKEDCNMSTFMHLIFLTRCLFFSQLITMILLILLIFKEQYKHNLRM